jgi:O-methyltransferase domain
MTKSEPLQRCTTIRTIAVRFRCEACSSYRYLDMSIFTYIVALVVCVVFVPVNGLVSVSQYRPMRAGAAAPAPRTNQFMWSQLDDDTKDTGIRSKEAYRDEIQALVADLTSLSRRDTIVGSAAVVGALPFLWNQMGPSHMGALSPTTIGVSRAALQGDAIVRNLWLSRLSYPVLIVALETGLFEALNAQSLTKDELGRRMTPNLKGQGRVLEAMVAVLASLELLQVSNDKVSLTEAGRAVLVQDSPFFWGSQLLAADGLTSSLRRALHTEDRPVKEYAGHSDATIGSFIDSMQAHGSVTAQATALALEPFIGPRAPVPARRVLDMAGGSGCFAAALASRGIPVTLADLPPVVTRWQQQRNRNDRRTVALMNAVPADLFVPATWPVGPDVHLLANVVHDWGSAQVMSILQASRAALQASSATQANGTVADQNGRPQYRLIVVEQLLSNDRAGPLPAALASVSMLLGDWRTGKQYSYAELEHYLKQAGFSRVELGPQCGDFHTAVIATL